MGACDAPDQCAPLTPIVQIMQSIPIGMGGVVEDGTYWSSVALYIGPGKPPSDLGGAAVAGTLVIAGGTIHQAITSTTTMETNGASGTFVTAGNTFTTDLTCGINGGVSTGTYTVSGKTVTLYFSIANVALVLVKQ